MKKEKQDIILRVQREKLLTESLGSIIGVNNHLKYVILLSKTFLDG